MIVDNRDPFVALDNEYHFHCYCSQKSIDAFNLSIAKGELPSRFYLILVAGAEILFSPFYLVKKICELVLNCWYFATTNEIQGKSRHFSRLTDTLGLITLQILTPFLCAAIRISAALLGVIYPRLALEGWKIAEAGELTANQIWASLKTNNAKTSENQACVEINPANASYYLGNEQTFTLLANDPVSRIQVENEIHVLFKNLLERIYQTQPRYFQKLLGLESNPKVFLSHDTKEILSRLHQLRKQLSAAKEADRKLIDTIFPGDRRAHLSLEEIHRLFRHVNLNLQSIAGKQMIEISIIDDLTRLIDLFSLCFKFGRAHFPQEKNHFFPYPRI